MNNAKERTAGIPSRSTQRVAEPPSSTTRQ